MDSLITAIYHRFILLGTDYTEVGIGDASHPTYGFTQVINPARQLTTAKPTKIIAIYPADSQADVPLTFNSDEESPDPVAEKNTVGYPVSIQFSSDYTVSLTDFTVSQNGVPLNAKILDKATDPNISANSYAVIPYDALEPETQYDVTFTGLLNGSPYTKTWSFITMEEPVFQASASAVTMASGQSVEIQLENVTSPYNMQWDNASVIDLNTAPGPKLIITGLQAGTTTLTVTDASSSSIQITITVTTSTPSIDINLYDGWNLVSSRIAFGVTDKLSDDTKYVSVWKWENSNWAVYLPDGSTQT